jgi:hypothetical protein
MMHPREVGSGRRKIVLNRALGHSAFTTIVPVPRVVDKGGMLASIVMLPNFVSMQDACNDVERRRRRHKEGKEASMHVENDF